MKVSTNTRPELGYFWGSLVASLPILVITWHFSYKYVDTPTVLQNIFWALFKTAIVFSLCKFCYRKMEQRAYIASSLFYSVCILIYCFLWLLVGGITLAWITGFGNGYYD
jgi:hypothetical protein